jgi:hypothetical protein
VRPSSCRQPLHFAADLAALVQNPSDLDHGFDLLTRSYATPAADVARAALRNDPAIAPLMKARYWGGVAQLPGAAGIAAGEPGVPLRQLVR